MSWQPTIKTELNYWNGFDETACYVTKSVTKKCWNPSSTLLFQTKHIRMKYKQLRNTGRVKLLKLSVFSKVQERDISSVGIDPATLPLLFGALTDLATLPLVARCGSIYTPQCNILRQNCAWLEGPNFVCFLKKQLTGTLLFYYKTTTLYFLF